MYVWNWILKVSTVSSWNHCFVFIPIITACNQPAFPCRKGSETEDDKVAFPVVRPLCHLLTSVPDYCHCHYGLHWDITGKTQGLSCLLVSQQQTTFLWAKNILFLDMRVYVCVLRKENENTYSGKTLTDRFDGFLVGEQQMHFSTIPAWRIGLSFSFVVLF